MKSVFAILSMVSHTFSVANKKESFDLLETAAISSSNHKISPLKKIRRDRWDNVTLK